MDEGSVDHGPASPTRPAASPALLGDIVLCPEVAAEQAATAGHAVDDELHLLTVHGVLHLLGYDHAEPDEEREMFALQAQPARRLAPSRAGRRRRRPQRRSDPAVLGTAGLEAPTVRLIAPLLVVAAAAGAAGRPVRR